MSDSELESTIDPKRQLKSLLVPTILVILIAVMLSVMTLDFYAFYEQEPVSTAPFEEDPNNQGGGIVQGALANAIFYVVFAFLGGVILFILLKRGFESIIVIFFAVIMGFSWFTFGLFYTTIIFISILNFIWEFLPEFLQISINLFFNQGYYDIALLLFAILLGIVGLLSFMVRRVDLLWIRNAMMILFGSMIGSLLGIHFPFLSAVFVLIALSIYDIYAVFRGPLKDIIDYSSEQSENEIEIPEEEIKSHPEKYQLSLLSMLPVYATPLINIGLGDFAFFSMLSSLAIRIGYELNSILLPIVFTLVGIFAGIYITYDLLQKKRAMPGLPLPVLLGIIGLFSSILIVTGFNIDKILTLFV